MTTKLKDHTLSLNAAKAVAFCSCRGWAVEGFNAEYARRNHKYHLTNLPDNEKEKRTSDTSTD